MNIEFKLARAYLLRQSTWSIKPMSFSLEILFSIIIIGILMAISYGSYANLITKAKITEAFYTAINARTDMATHFALHGTWPDKLQGSKTTSEFVKDFDIHPAGLTVTFADGVVQGENRQLTFRFASQDGAFLSPFRTLCGYHPISTGEISGENRTNIASIYLTSNCR